VHDRVMGRLERSGRRGLRGSRGAVLAFLAAVSLLATCATPEEPATTPVSAVRVTPSTLEIRVGEHVRLTATALDVAGTPLPGRSILWASTSEAVASVDSAGVVSGAGLGTVTISATSDGKCGTSAVSVGPGPRAQATVVPDSLDMLSGQTAQLASGGTVSGGSTQSFTSPYGGNAVLYLDR
jgi:hypothetical protein